MSIKFSIGIPARSIARFALTDRQRLARRIEELGFAAHWHSNERFYQDLWMGMTVSALATTRIQLGSAVVEPYSVHPLLTAVSLATFDHLSGGRAILGIAPGGSGFPAMCVERPRPVVAIREAVQVIRRLLAGETVTLDGEVITIHAGRLHFTPLRKTVPIVIAGRGGKILRVGGEIGDGVMIATYATVDGLRHAINEVLHGARKAGRTVEGIDLMSRVDTCILPDRERARASMRTVIALMLWASFPNWGFVDHLGLRVPDTLRALIARRDYDLMHEVGAMVPDEFIDAYTWAGTAADVTQRIIALLATGVRHFGFWIRTNDPQEVLPMIEAIAREVCPAVERAAAQATRRSAGGC